MKIYHIVAVSKNNVIGKDGDLPFKIPGDLKRFKELTVNHAVLMGRKTWESLPEKYRPLKDRLNLCVSRSFHESEGGEKWFSQIEHAVKFAKDSGYSELYIIGGAEIYRQTMNIVHEIRMTLWNEEIEGDTYYFGNEDWDVQQTLDMDFITTFEDDRQSHKYLDLVPTI